MHKAKQFFFACIISVQERRTATDNRQIRLDVYAIDEDDVIYEVEA